MFGALLGSATGMGAAGAYGAPAYGAAPGYGAPSALGGAGAPAYGATPGYGAPPAGGLFTSLKTRVMGPQAPVQYGPDGRPLPPGYEPPTPVPLPEDTNDQNQGAIVAAILGGSAILGLALGCALFRKKGVSDGDSDSDAGSDDDSDESD
jgi:hypothetical protein